MICLTNLGMINRKLGNYALSAEHYRNGLLLAEELPGNRDERVIAYMMEGVARLAVKAGKPRQAAWLLAAEVGLRKSIAAPRPPLDKEGFGQFVTEISSALDPSSFDAAWSDGLESKADSAISAALEIVYGYEANVPRP
jgi:hypothetical protein